MRDVVPVYLWIQEQQKLELVLNLGGERGGETAKCLYIPKQTAGSDLHNTERPVFGQLMGGITQKTSEIHTLITSVRFFIHFHHHSSIWMCASPCIMVACFTTVTW
jgi:hypothetical protein